MCGRRTGERAELHHRPDAALLPDRRAAVPAGGHRRSRAGSSTWTTAARPCSAGCRWRHTGLASRRASADYHGPGRGAGNSIGALLDGHRLTGERRYLDKAEKLIRRCIHPDRRRRPPGTCSTRRIAGSTRCSCRSLGRYLDDKAELGRGRRSYAYARAACCITRAGWPSTSTRISRSRRSWSIPTETWAAQDMRKSEVFKFAALLTTSDDDRRRFLQRADHFFSASVGQLQTMPSRVYTRPIVILLSCGFMHAAFAGGNFPPTLHRGHPWNSGRPPGSFRNERSQPCVQRCSWDSRRSWSSC